MKPVQLMEALEVLIKSRQPAHVWGGPGVGKSDCVRAVAHKLKRELRDVRAVLLDAIDLRGLPNVSPEGKSRWAIPDFLPREGEGILFLDELNRAPMLVQNACLQLILDRQIGEYRLPDGWDVLAAGNRMSDGGGVTKMNSALSTRFRHLDFEPDLDQWCAWGIRAGVEPVVIAFVRFRPELLYKFEAGERTFPCPRTHEAVSKIVACKPSPAIEHDLYRGAYGDGAAVEFSAFLNLYRELPDIDKIIENPSKAPVPEKPASLFAVSCALGQRMNVENFDRIVTYMNKLSDEYNILCVKDALIRDSKITEAPGFVRWSIKHSEVVF